MPTFTPSGKDHFVSLFEDQTCGLGILATSGLVTARPQSRANSSYKVTKMPMNDVMVPYTLLTGKFHFPILTPQVGEAGLPHP